MKLLLAILIFFSSLAVNGQDKVYFLNGRTLMGKVTEITPSHIVLVTDAGNENLQKEEVLLVQFKNGQFEKINEPVADAVNGRARTAEIRTAKTLTTRTDNIGGVNTLALVNADISVFYERLIAGRKVGFGLMAAYNFNRSALLYNTNIFILNNAKKNYDAGFFLNFYTGDLSRKRTLYCGVMIKYTGLSFSALREDSVRNGNTTAVNITYTPSRGHQLATLLTLGVHRTINERLFVRTTYGLGGFNLKGIYREQYNYMSNRFTPANERRNSTFLFKVYLAISAGYFF
jgi:hypothetical protein